MSKIPIMSAEEAIRLIKKGDIVGIPTFYHVGIALDLINALANSDLRELHVISNDPGLPGIGTGKLIRNKQIADLIVSYIATNKEAMEMYIRGELPITMFPQGTLITKLWAGASGGNNINIGGFLTRTGIGTEVENGKYIITLNNIDYILETPLRCRVALVKAKIADTMGNVVFSKAARNFNEIMAKASDITIIEADEILPEGEYLNPNYIHLPFCYTSCLVKSSGRWKNDLKVLQRETTEKLSPSRLLIVKRAAKLLKDGDIVNLGIGTPLEVAKFIPSNISVHLMSENGILGMGPPPEEGCEDNEICNAGRGASTILPGGSFFDSFEAFNMIRGGRIDKTILGAFQVDEEGNLANYKIPGKSAPGIGGGMDLVIGAKEVIIATEHTAKGKSKIVTKCTLPLTGQKVVKWIVTNLALIEVTINGLVLRETAPNVTVEEILAKTEAKLLIPEDIKTMEI